MSDYVIVVPKQDELFGVEWGFDTSLSRPDARTRSGVELYRRDFPFGSVTFALMNRQTNTYSSVQTADVIARETPWLIFLAGTALGHAERVPVGSVVVSDGVIDISEKRYTDLGREHYISHGLLRSDALTLDARDFISRTFTNERVHALMRSMARKPNLLRGSRKVSEFVARHNPVAVCEPIVSGNEYRMTGAGQEVDQVWAHAPTARAYDMEAAGFALAASFSAVPWLVVRGISDHGTIETKSDFNRRLAAGIASRFLFEFLRGGLGRAKKLPELPEPSTTIPLLRDQAYRLDGAWKGAMAYLDDDGSPVVFEEEAEFIQDGDNVQGTVTSRKIAGLSRHDELEYRVSFSIARHGYAGGVWSETVATRKYFGVMLGEFGEDSTVLSGTWMGTHRGGVRRGFFKWYNVDRADKSKGMTVGLESTVADLVGSFTDDIQRSYNDACKVFHDEQVQSRERRTRLPP
jgi:nucleoside phosphorylase